MKIVYHIQNANRDYHVIKTCELHKNKVKFRNFDSHKVTSVSMPQCEAGMDTQGRIACTLIALKSGLLKCILLAALFYDRVCLVFSLDIM